MMDESSGFYKSVIAPVKGNKKTIMQHAATGGGSVAATIVIVLELVNPRVSGAEKAAAEARADTAYTKGVVEQVDKKIDHVSDLLEAFLIKDGRMIVDTVQVVDTLIVSDTTKGDTI